MVNESEIGTRFQMLSPFLNERTRRLAAAAEAAAIGRGGISRVARATGVSRRAIRSGLAQLRSPVTSDGDRIRRAGGGRRKVVATDTTLKSDLERLIDPVTRGDPESPLRWTCKSVRKLAEELQGMGHATSRRMVAELLHELGYSLQANRKTFEGKGHPDRNAQFEHINAKVQAALKAGEPVISVDAKKKELVGDFKNAGREWQPEGNRNRCGSMTSSSRDSAATRPHDYSAGLTGLLRDGGIGYKSDHAFRSSPAARGSAMDESQLLALKPELDRFLDRFAPLFGRDENQAHARRFVQGLLHGGERRNAENIAQAMSGGPVRSLQAFITTGAWPRRRRSSGRCAAACWRCWPMTTRSGTPTRPASPRRGPGPSA